MIRIFAERDRFWLVAAGEIRSIAFELDRGTLPLGDPIPIVRPDTPGEVEVARLDRSAFLVLEAKGLVEIAVDGARRPILLPPTVVTPTLLAADTERHVWLSGEWGGLAAVDLTAPSRAPICAALLPEERAHALAASADRVAAVTIRGDVNAPRWSVAVFGPDGRELLRVDVPWELPLSAPDVSVAIGGTPLSLAVATDERLAVWDLASGRKILER